MSANREAALKTMKKLERAGYQAFLVGGCVRDRLRGVEPADYDVATDAHPEAVMALFPGTAPTGLAHGTVTVTAEGAAVEVTTFRREAGYSDHRRPDEVQFVSDLTEDLARRDFTINAMAEDLRGQVMDPFGGQEDLKRKTIRAVGEPLERFTEDALRMVRAIRFHAQLGFTIDPRTEAAIASCRENLRPLAVERVTAELDKMWKAPHPAASISLLWMHGLFCCLPPFFQWDSIADQPQVPLSHLDRFPDSDTRWVFFLLACGVEADKIGMRLESLRLPSRSVKRMVALAQIAAYSPAPPTAEEAKRWMLEYGGDLYREGISLFPGLERLGVEATERLSQDAVGWLEVMPILRREELALDGQELADSLHRVPGPWLKPMLEHLLEQVALGRIPNTKQALIEAGEAFGKPDS
ncbi:CCA tRNA nucleotidyltransferase [Desmospora activa]|uniref:tRNA nucleotidyltransferase (CCA-adding enzyme) n=1 Tax=Desmospora activa DSM 45169 TaxID=1121389 RepID=A0A2T4ZA50_9BACL|nr:CCA tRNA nucleotidyltransferase [Desmospora activa]PTM58743.1 tRNA nucleotidyltransferase (CCA-adding enzyme) [Desmospora activa DSM 45169]